MDQDQDATTGEHVSTCAVTIRIGFLDDQIGKRLRPCPDWPDLN